MAEGGKHERAILQADGLCMAFGERVVLQDVDVRVEHGEVVVILGGSGCGKSTLLKVLIGLHQPQRGRVLLEGRDLIGAAGEERRAILGRIGVLYQGGALFGSMTLLENVLLPLRELSALPPEAAHAVAIKKLQLVGLGEFLHDLPSEVSGGMQKRAALARAMALDPPILFLDEPSAGLDPVTSAELDALVRGLANDLGLTFVVVTHELASIFAIADRALFLDRETHGIVANGPPAELRDSCEIEAVRRFFRREPASATT